MSPTCCAGLTWKDGRKPNAVLVRQDSAGKWGCIVGSAMLDGYETQRELMRAITREQRDQRVFPCGHVVRKGEDHA